MSLFPFPQIAPPTQVRRTVWLAGRRPFLGSSPAEWLVGMRWAAVVGMFITATIAHRLVPGIPFGAIAMTIGAIAALNVLWTFGPTSLRPTAAAQLVFDVLSLGGVLWLAGGVGNPFAVFLTFQVALAGLLCGGQTSLRLAVLVVATAAVLYFATPLPWETAIIGVDRTRHLAHATALIGLAAFVGVPAHLYRRRLDALRDESARNERFAVLGRVTGGMAHELNTPLATILVAGEELLDVGRATGSPEIERLSVVVAQEARRASDVIAMLRGQLRATRMAERIDVSKMLAELVPSELDALDFDGERVIDVPRGMRAWGTPAAVRQILGNVLKNAVEAMDAKAGRRIEVSVEQRGDCVDISVRDNGCGIAAEQLKHVGEPFITTKETTGGTGLGLYVSSLLAEQMNATLHIEGGSHGTAAGGHDKGTRVTLSLQSARSPSRRPLGAS